MKRIYFTLVVLAMLMANTLKAQVIAGWNYQSVNPAAPISHPANTSTKDPNLGVAEIQRGSGLSTASINYGINSGVTGLTGNTENDAITSGDYYLVNLKASSGTLTVTKIIFRIYRHTNGPQRFRWAYNVNGGAYTTIGTEVDMTGVANSDILREIDLSADANLANVPNTSTITFRLVGYDGNGTTNKNFGLRSNNSNALSFEGSLSATLPVELISFTAKPQANAVQLNWQTASEQRNSHFEILRSADGVSFNVIGTKEGNGTTQSKQYYSFEDKQPLNGTSYYALKQFDEDGIGKLYDAISVKMNMVSSTFTVAPSAAGISIHMEATLNEKANVSIVDISGNKIVERQLLLNKGVNRLEIDNVALAKDKLYLVNLKSASINQTAKIIK